MPERVLELRSDDDPDGALMRLAFERAASDSGLDHFKVEVHAQGISCDHWALSLDGDGLEGFIAELAGDWRGWDGRGAGMLSSTE